MIARMKNYSAILKFIILFSAVALLVLINSKANTPKSALQASFDNWLNQFKLALEADGTTNPRPVVALSLQSTYPEMQVAWNLASNGNADLERKSVRLLELTSEAGIFNLPETRADESSLITFSIEEGTHRYVAKFKRKSVEENVAAQTLFKLFQLYATQNQTPSLSQP